MKNPTQPRKPAPDRLPVGTRITIGTVLNTFSIVVALVPVLIVVLVATRFFSDQARDQSVNQLQTLAESKADEVARWLENGEVRLNAVLANAEQVRDMRSVVSSPFANPGLMNSVNVFLNDQLSAQATFDELYLYDLDGQVRLSTNPDYDDSVSVTGLPFFEASLESTHYEPPFFNEEADRLELVVTTPIFRTDDSQDIIGVLAGRLNLLDLASLVEVGSSLGDTGEVYLVNNESLMLTPGRFGDAEAGSRISSEGILASVAGSDGDGFYDNYREQPVIGAYRYIDTLDSAVIAEIEQSEALAAVNDVIEISLIVAAITAVIVFLIGRAVTFWLTYPINKLKSVATAVVSGDYSQRANLAVITEIGQMGYAFDRMTDQLVNSLEERNRRIDEIEELSSNLETRVEQRTRDIRLATEVAKQITTVLDIDVLLSQVAQLTVAGYNLYACNVYSVNEDRQMLRRTAGVDEMGQVVTASLLLPLDRETSIAGYAASTHTPVIINDDHTVPDGLDSPTGEAKAMIAIPMMLGDRVMGVFEAQARRSDRFRDDEVSVLNTLAEQTAVAVRNAQLYTDAMQARKEAEEASTIKSQFLANMSHELRTPLNAILNFAEFVADGDLGEVNDEQVDALSKIISSGEHLLSLINDVLDVTKIEVGLLELFIEEVNVNHSLLAVISTGKGLVKDRPVNLVTNIQPNLPVLKGDRRRLHQVFLNLLSNAVKFTPEGTINLTARHDDTMKSIVVSVEDTGVGIAEDEKHMVFESFKQAEQGRLSGMGTGLGLPISKHFVEAHGGTIKFDSILGKGSTFTVILPVDFEPADKLESEALA